MRSFKLWSLLALLGSLLHPAAARASFEDDLARVVTFGGIL